MQCNIISTVWSIYKKRSTSHVSVRQTCEFCLKICSNSEFEIRWNMHCVHRDVFLQQIGDPELWQRNPVQQIVAVLSIEWFWPLNVLNNAAVPWVANESSVDVPVRPKYTAKSLHSERAAERQSETNPVLDESVRVFRSLSNRENTRKRPTERLFWQMWFLMQESASNEINTCK